MVLIAPVSVHCILINFNLVAVCCIVHVYILVQQNLVRKSKIVPWEINSYITLVILPKATFMLQEIV